MNRHLLSLVFVVMGTSAVAQVSVTEQQSADKSSTRTQIAMTTLDRTAVPFVMDTKETKVDANTSRKDSVTQVRRNDGALVELNHISSVTRKTGANTTEISTELVEKDRQGQSQTTRKVSETVTKTPAGEERRAVEYRRDSSGNMVLDGETRSTSTKNSDGTVTSVRMDNRADVNGRLVPKGQVEETIKPQGANEKSITRTTKAVGLEGRVTVTGQETETVSTQGNTTRTETTTMKPGRDGMVVDKRTTTTETRNPDGTTKRETVETSRSLHSTYTGDRDEPLVPTYKTVESEVRQSDGSVRLQRDVLRRDVNGDWKPVTFSADTGSMGADKKSTGN